MKKILFLSLFVLLSSALLSQPPAVQYTIPVDSAEVLVDADDQHIYLRTPQKNEVVRWAYAQYVTNGKYEGIAYYGTEATIVVAETFVSLSYKDGRVYFWFFQ